MTRGNRPVRARVRVIGEPHPMPNPFQAIAQGPILAPTLAAGQV